MDVLTENIGSVPCQNLSVPVTYDLTDGDRDVRRIWEEGGGGNFGLGPAPSVILGNIAAFDQLKFRKQEWPSGLRNCF